MHGRALLTTVSPDGRGDVDRDVKSGEGGSTSIDGHESRVESDRLAVGRLLKASARGVERRLGDGMVLGLELELYDVSNGGGNGGWRVDEAGGSANYDGVHSRRRGGSGVGRSTFPASIGRRVYRVRHGYCRSYR